MRISLHRALALLLLVRVFALPGGAPAQNVPPEAVQQTLAELDERIAFYKTHYPTLNVDELLKGTSREQVAALLAVDPRKALETIDQIHQKLDRQGFALVKREIFRVGATVQQDPTTTANATRRRALLFEFAEIVKRRGLVLNSYYPGGRAKFLLIRTNTPDTFRAIDERLKTLSERLKREVEEERATQAGGGGGGWGGGSFELGGPTESSGEAGAFGGRPGDDPVDAETRRGLPGSSDSWATIILLGFIVIAIGSALVLLLPRFVAYGRSVLKSSFREPSAPAADDPFKLGLALFQKGKFDKAQSHFEKVAAETGDRASTGTYYLALCQAKQGFRAKTIQLVSAVPFGSLTTEEVYRLGRACEESGCTETAIKLYQEIKARDSSYKDVEQRLLRCLSA